MKLDFQCLCSSPLGFGQLENDNIFKHIFAQGMLIGIGTLNWYPSIPIQRNTELRPFDVE
jgi:hypothetical protein